jgi:hypothetical protein
MGANEWIERSPSRFDSERLRVREHRGRDLQAVS